MYTVGQVIQGTVTGIKPYGAFVRIDDEYTGLIHISEINDGFVNNVNSFVKQGEKVVVKIIDIDRYNHRLRLSLKAINATRRRNRHMPAMKRNQPGELGFKPLQEKLEEWIKQEEKNEI